MGGYTTPPTRQPVLPTPTPSTSLSSTVVSTRERSISCLYNVVAAISFNSFFGCRSTFSFSVLLLALPEQREQTSSTAGGGSWSFRCSRPVRHRRTLWCGGSHGGTPPSRPGSGGHARAAAAIGGRRECARS